MKKGLIILVLAALLVAAGYYFLGQSAEPELLDACDPGRLAETARPYIQLLRRFDDTARLALNLPRTELTEPIMHLQEIRRELDDFEHPPCMLALGVHMQNYMNGLIDVLVSFLGGASTAQAQAGMDLTQPLRSALEDELSSLLGATLTPYPTPLTAALIPVTGPSAATAIPASPTAFVVLATVVNPDGANLRFGPGVDYTFRHTLSVDSRVALLGISEDGRWVLAYTPELEEGQGWLFLPLVTIEGPLDLLPTVTE